MKKQKIKLSLKLNKQVVSKLDGKKIIGGNSVWLCMRTEVPWACRTEHDCPTAGGPSICGGIQHG